MATLSVQTIAPTGLVPSYAAANSSDAFPDDGRERTFLHVKNGGGSSINVTIPAQRTSRRVPGAGTITVPDMVVAVANGAEKMIGPFPDDYRGLTTGNVTVNYSATSSVTAAVLQVPRQD